MSNFKIGIDKQVGSNYIEGKPWKGTCLENGGHVNMAAEPSLIDCHACIRKVKYWRYLENPNTCDHEWYGGYCKLCDSVRDLNQRRINNDRP